MFGLDDSVSPTIYYLQFMHTCQIALCIYAASLSYTAISKLRGYEATSKKLAEWSKEAEFQLFRTRTTQTTGVIAILSSLAMAATLIYCGPALPTWARFISNPTMLIVVLFCRGHITNYWAPKDGKTVGMKVPLPNMGDYNAAQTATEELIKILAYIEYSWLATSFVGGVLGYR